MENIPNRLFIRKKTTENCKSTRSRIEILLIDYKMHNIFAPDHASTKDVQENSYPDHPSELYLQVFPLSVDSSTPLLSQVLSLLGL